MHVLTKLLILTSFLLISFYAVPQVSAAIAFPECRWDEITFSCQCPHAYNVCADNTCSQCLQYKNDPRYYYLWKDIYCRKGSMLELVDKYKASFVLPLLTTVVLELIVFAARGFRKARQLLYVTLTNGMTFALGMLLLGINPQVNNLLQTQKLMALLPTPLLNITLYGMDIPRILSLLIIGGVMTVFETLFLVSVAKFGDRKTVLKTALVAHLISLVLGLGTLNAVYPHFLLPRLF